MEREITEEGRNGGGHVEGKRGLDDKEVFTFFQAITRILPLFLYSQLSKNTVENLGQSCDTLQGTQNSVRTKNTPGSAFLECGPGIDRSVENVMCERSEHVGP